MLFRSAPLHGDTQTGKLTYTNSYYYIGHFSKFIRPGAKRIAVTPSRSQLLATGFINTDGSVVVVVMNESEINTSYKLWVKGKAVNLSSPSHSIMTMVF